MQKFWAWAKNKNLIAGELFKFALTPLFMAEATQRDSWTDEEARDLFALPLFSGCKSDAHFWIEGNCLVQNELYWGYIFAFFLGLRSSEISKIKIENIVKKGDVTLIGLRSSRSQVRSFNPQPSDKTTLKTASSERDVPISDFFLELGLAARIEELKQRGETLLFPEWTTYERKTTGELMPGHHLSKSFQYIKTRKTVFGETATLHGARHAVATRMDEASIPERIRNQVLGHQPATIASGYGAKFLTEAEAKLFLGRNNALEKEIVTLLLAARQKVDEGKMQLITRVERVPASFKKVRASKK